MCDEILTEKEEKEQFALYLFQLRIAEFQSSYPDLPIVLQAPQFTSQRDCLKYLGAILYVSDDNDYYSSSWVIRRIANLCYHHQYNEIEKWNKFQDLIEQVLTYRQYVDFVKTELMSPNDFYGNLEHEIKITVRNLRIKSILGQNGPVLEPKRKRGYDDKGTLRPDWEKREGLYLSSDSREDRRNLVLHPLVGEREDYPYPPWSENEQFQGIMCDRNSRTKKRGEDYDILRVIESYRSKRRHDTGVDEQTARRNFKSIKSKITSPEFDIKKGSA